MHDLLYRYLTILDKYSSATKTTLGKKTSSAYRATDRKTILNKAIKEGLVTENRISTRKGNDGRAVSVTIYSITDLGRKRLREHEEFLNKLLKNQAPD